MLNTILSDYKDLIATAILVAALVILVALHTAAFSDIIDLLKMIATYWFFRGGITYAQSALARLQIPVPEPAHEEEKHA